MIKPENLLIVRTDRIGDVILTLPLAGIIKKHFPQCKVTFLVREYTSSLVYDTKYIDDVMMLPESSGKMKFLETFNSVKKKKFDSVIIVHPSFKIALALFLARITLRIGTAYRWYYFLFTKRVHEHRKYAKYHELEYNVHLLKQLNIEEAVNKSNVKYNLTVDKRSELKIEQLLLKHIKDQSLPIIIFHPGSSGSAVDLPLAKMKKLIELTAQELNVNIVLTGSKDETEICGKLAISEKVVNLSGMFNLAELKALINRSELLIANSTGPLHIASALGKYVIGFYPKIRVCSPERWGPYTNKGKVFQPKLACNDCTTEQCKKLDCMNSIDLNEVLEQIRKVINGNYYSGV